MRATISLGLGSTMFIVLFVLKLIGLIEMGWFAVLTSWIWVPLLVYLTALAAVFIFGVIVIVFAALFGK